MTFETQRLVLRALRPEDASTVAQLAGRREIAHTTISIPHPYSEQQAQEWIATHTGQQNLTKQVAFAITTKADGELVGTMGLRDIDQEHCQAEMGFWIGVEWWGTAIQDRAARPFIAFCIGDQAGFRASERVSQVLPDFIGGPHHVPDADVVQLALEEVDAGGEGGESAPSRAAVTLDGAKNLTVS
jgi:hypothetical protein